MSMLRAIEDQLGVAEDEDHLLCNTENLITAIDELGDSDSDVFPLWFR